MLSTYGETSQDSIYYQSQFCNLGTRGFESFFNVIQQQYKQQQQQMFLNISNTKRKLLNKKNNNYLSTCTCNIIHTKHSKKSKKIVLWYFIAIDLFFNFFKRSFYEYHPQRDWVSCFHHSKFTY